MGLEYSAVQWNRQKRIYDFVLAGGVGAFLILFGALSKAFFPFITDEIMLIRTFAAAAFVLLHVILCIGPLCRLDRRFLPLLYNRRHAGVTMCLLGLVHAALVVITYHAGGDTNPILSIFKGSPLTGSIAGVPFQPFGFFALVILLLMAATSHDFWLANLSAPVWKSLHMLVHVAYALLVLHVTFGVLQAEVNPVYAVVTGAGLTLVLGLHIAAAFKEAPTDRAHDAVSIDDGFIDACAVAEIPEKRARIVCLSGERVAIFKYDGRVSAVSNVCQHQNGPLGEGKILDGCITCPWHGYQYLPDTGASPAPFVEKVPTFNVRVKNGRVLVHPTPNPPGIHAEPALVAAGVSPAGERGVSPGGRSAEAFEPVQNSSQRPDGKMPLSTAGKTPAAT
jgi:nitrite reductase/ring-hydroxylating ferredoxin subunit/DMSO/TMAO reductase YedYZ heme-binding membrane subunit